MFEKARELNGTLLDIAYGIKPLNKQKIFELSKLADAEAEEIEAELTQLRAEVEIQKKSNLTNLIGSFDECDMDELERWQNEAVEQIRLSELGKAVEYLAKERIWIDMGYMRDFFKEDTINEILKVYREHEDGAE